MVEKRETFSQGVDPKSILHVRFSETQISIFRSKCKADIVQQKEVTPAGRKQLLCSFKFHEHGYFRTSGETGDILISQTFWNVPTKFYSTTAWYQYGTSSGLSI